MIKGIPVKVIDVSGNFVSMKYTMSNSRSRITKTQFIESCENGELIVNNPGILPEDLQEKIAKD